MSTTVLRDAGDAAATLTHLTEQEGLARLGIVMELGTLTFQALVSLWSYRLFRSVDTFLTVSILVLGTGQRGHDSREHGVPRDRAERGARPLPGRRRRHGAVDVRPTQQRMAGRLGVLRCG